MNCNINNLRFSYQSMIILNILFLFLVNTAFATTEKPCEAHEEYLPCGPACPSTCDNSSTPCVSKRCVDGCFCTKGYIRETKGGKCISEEECRNNSKCNKNEIYSNCSSCEANCNPDGRCPVFPIRCEPRCVCKGGFIRSHKGGPCIPIDSCKSQCRGNREYNSCGTACPGTCSHPVKPCTKQCAPGCFCKDGYILSDDTGECIKKEDCPKEKCPENEEFLKCGTACPATCQEKPENCTRQCVEGCFCKKGYVRLSFDGPCVPEKSCVDYPKCDGNMTLSTCATACPLTCNNDEPKICPLYCKIGCICKNGYIRSTSGGPCIREEDCKGVCTGGRVYNACGSPCPRTCLEPYRTCGVMCVKGCFCQNGTVINEETNQCVKQGDCPKESH